MIIEVNGYHFLTLVSAVNNDGTTINPYIMKRGRDKGFFQYSLDGTNHFKRANLVELLEMLITDQFNDQGRIRMRYIKEPTKYNNNALSPIFKKSELIAFRKTL